jgi:hypothetical protein
MIKSAQLHWFCIVFSGENCLKGHDKHIPPNIHYGKTRNISSFILWLALVMSCMGISLIVGTEDSTSAVAFLPLFVDHFYFEFAEVISFFEKDSLERVAVIGGAFSLGVLWFYLIFGRGNQMMWNFAVAAAGIAGALQLCTLFILACPVCQRDDCTR